MLQTIAEWNPVSALANGLRELFGNPVNPVTTGDPWPLHHPVAYTLICSAAIVAIAAPLAIRAYQRSLTD